jgi:hypothetical protein
MPELQNANCGRCTGHVRYVKKLMAGWMDILCVCVCVCVGGWVGVGGCMVASVSIDGRSDGQQNG